MKPSLPILLLMAPLFGSGLWFLDRSTHWAGDHINESADPGANAQKDGLFRKKHSLRGKHYVFAPKDCGFRIRLDQVSEVSTEPRGGVEVHRATTRYEDGNAVRASCGPLFVFDQEAFLAKLPDQMNAAARSLGLEDYEVEVRQEGSAMIASFSGYRVQEEEAEYVFSETRVRNNHFVELLFIVEPEDSGKSTLRRMAQVIGATT